MRPAGLLRKPKFVGESRPGVIFINKETTLYLDSERRTIWIDLKAENFTNSSQGVINFPIKRINIGTAHDYGLIINPKIKDVIESFVIAPQIPLEHIAQLILDPTPIDDENFKQFLESKIKEFDNSTKEELINFIRGLANVQTKNINTLLGDDRYAHLLGNFTPDEELDYKVATEEIKFRKPKVTEADFLECFDDIILDPKKALDTFNAMGIASILAGEIPKTGGAILIDHGGTGKSMMKKGLIKFWKTKLGGAVKEKEQGDISSYVNAAPQLIKVWYRGGKMTGVQEGPQEEDLVAEARKKHIPSLLVIDEAEDFVIDDKGIGSKQPITGSTQSLKRFIQDYEKGGVTGYVLTLLIANVDNQAIHDPLKQGGERLTAIHYGPPVNVEEWVKIMEIGTKNLQFESNGFNLNILANIILEHNKHVSHESFMITPRTTLEFFQNYYGRFTPEDSTPNNNSEIFKTLRANTKKDKWKIHFHDFVKNFIERELKKNLGNDNSHPNRDEALKSYYRILNETPEVKEEEVTVDEKKPKIDYPEKEYEEYFKLIKSWQRTIHEQSSQNLFTDESLKLIVNILKKSKIVINKLGEGFEKIKKDIEVINLIFNRILEIKQTRHTYLQQDSQIVQDVFNLINLLPDKLNNEEED